MSKKCFECYKISPNFNCNSQVKKISLDNYNFKNYNLDNVNFQVIDKQKIINLDLKQIILTDKIINALKEEMSIYEYDYSIVINRTSKKYFKDFSSPLIYSNNIRESFEKKEKLSPIIVIPVNSGSLYHIIKGRHRFLMSVLFNNQSIKAYILE